MSKKFAFERQDYFQNPEPVLSKENSERLSGFLSNKQYDFVVEYGTGASTFFILNSLLNFETTFISIETVKHWFDRCIEELEKVGIAKISRTDGNLGFFESLNLLVAHPANNTDNLDIPKSALRLPIMQDIMILGWFYRFSPNAKTSRLRGMLGFFFPPFKFLFLIFTVFKYLFFKITRPETGIFIGKRNNVLLKLKCRGPSIIKDQFGECSNKMEYIAMGLEEIESKLNKGETVSAFFIIDAGPRHNIVDCILNLEERFNNFSPTIFPCEAGRVFYNKTIQRRKNGAFLPGTNYTIKGFPINSGVNSATDLWYGKNSTIKDIQDREVWLYSK